MNKLLTTLRRTGFYTQRLRKEKISKIIVMTVASLALVLQLSAGILPFSSTPAHALGSDNVVSVPAHSKADVLANYDHNHDSAGHTDIKQIYAQFGVSRQDLVDASIGTYKMNDFSGGIKSVGRTNFQNTGRTPVAVAGTNTTVYTGPFLDGGNSKAYVIPALIGHRSLDGHWFAITLDCGNMVYVVPPTPPKPPTPVYTCDELTVTRIDRTTVKFATDYTVKNATVTSVVYLVRNASGQQISSSTATTYTQTTPGAYTVQAVVNVSVGGKVVTASGASCTKPFETVKQATPAIAITKLVDGTKYEQVAVNQTFNYQLKVTNTGDVTLTNAVVTDKAPTGVTFISASSGTVTDTNWTQTLASLKPGESITITIKAKVPSAVSGKVVNTACVTAPQVPAGAQCAKATIEVPTTPVTPPAPVTPTTPPELPHTGLGNTVGSLLGLGSVIASVGYYVASRRGLLSALLSR